MVIKTRIIKVDPELIELDKIKTIAEVLRKGGIIVYPTDTFYGLGVNCYLKNAVQKVYRLKRRKPSKPLSLVVSDIKMVKEISIDIPPVFKLLTDEFWPGPLTLVLKASSKLPGEAQSSTGSIGLRVPALSWLRSLIKQAVFPITATSANVSGEKEIAEPEKVIETFYGKVDLIADGGETREILPSTVIDLTPPRPRILREGAVPLSRLRKYLERKI